MPGSVIDASALGALVFAEPGADSVVAALTDAELIAPLLLPFEVASICRKKSRALPEQRERFLKVFSRIGNMGIRYAEIDFAEVTALALDHGLTTYDAAYLWLAIENEAFLVTLDLDFARVAKKVLPPGRVLPQE